MERLVENSLGALGTSNETAKNPCLTFSTLATHIRIGLHMDHTEEQRDT